MGKWNGRHTCKFCKKRFHWDFIRHENTQQKQDDDGTSGTHLLCPHCLTFEDGEKYVPESPTDFDLAMESWNELEFNPHGGLEEEHY